MYYIDELIALGCSEKHARKLHSCLTSTYRSARKSSLKAYQYELPIGGKIEDMTNDETVIPLRAVKKRTPRDLEE
jgi:hypothetical protein